MWHGRPPSRQMRPFLRRAVYDSKRSRKVDEHERNGHYLGPAMTYSSGTCRVRNLETGMIVTTCDLRWYSTSFSPKFYVRTTYMLPSTEHGGKGDEQRGRSASTAQSIGVPLLVSLQSLLRIRAATARRLRGVEMMVQARLEVAATMIVELTATAIATVIEHLFHLASELLYPTRPCTSLKYCGSGDAWRRA